MGKRQIQCMENLEQLPKPTLNKIHRDSQSNTFSVSKFAQYYFSRSPRCANLSTARTIVRAKRSNISYLKNV